MSNYLLLKYLHVATVIISISGFVLRGIWMITCSPILQQRWAKIAPHINDTVLLLSAFALVVITAQYPGPQAWLNAKIIALVVYIGLGFVALKPKYSMPVRILAWCSALFMFGYIVLVALTKNSWPFS